MQLEPSQYCEVHTFPSEIAQLSKGAVLTILANQMLQGHAFLGPRVSHL